MRAPARFVPIHLKPGIADDVCRLAKLEEVVKREGGEAIQKTLRWEGSEALLCFGLVWVGVRKEGQISHEHSVFVLG